jgi:hypothetical protein
MREDIYGWLYKFEELNQIISNSGFGVFFEFLINLNEYDFIHLINNYINLYQPLVVSFDYIEKEEQIEIQEFILLQLYHYKNFDPNQKFDLQKIYEDQKEKKLEDKFWIIQKAAIANVYM